jgi:hypothetical protein
MTNCASVRELFGWSDCGGIMACSGAYHCYLGDRNLPDPGCGIYKCLQDCPDGYVM